MCISTVAQIVAIGAEGTARVDAQGRSYDVSLLALDEVVHVGDWLVIHSGLALHRISDDEARAAEEMRHQLGAES
jgi:hydrogenase expression/formation protein HypC